MKKIVFTLFLLFISTISQAAEISSAADELLAPDKAFAMSTRVVDANSLEASWKIAKGYYMYRDKFKFEVVSGDLDLGKPDSPKGIMKKDPTFGNTEIYKKKVVITLPITRTNNKAFTATLRITGQGCNDPIGVCYPPIVKTVKFDLPAAATTKTISSLEDLNKALAPDDEIPDFLEPDQAFKVTSLVEDNGKTIIIDFKIAKDYYLYHDKIKIKLKNAGGAKIEKINLPKGKIKDDPYFGKTEVHKKSFQAQVLISGVAADSAMLNVEYQGCAEQGICYAPARKNFPVKTGTGGISTSATDNGANGAVETGSKTASSNAYFIAILGAFITGLLLTFTPCVLPMIPILSGIIVGQGDGGRKKTSKFRGGGLAAIYVLGTSVTYTVAGIIAGRSGEQLQAHFQNPWAIGVFSLILALLALSMFGFYEIQMPSFIQSKMQSHSQKLKGGSFIGVFFIGIISALIVGACVSPLIISALGVAIASQDPTLGGLIMFSMAMGMGVVLVGLGFGADYLLPKAGMWMDRVKHFFGVLLIGVAIYLLGILPGVPVLLLWAALLIITSVYFGATQPLSETATGWRYFWKGVGTILLIWGVLALIGGFSGNRDIMRPISLSGAALMSVGGAQATTAGHVFEKVSTVAELEKHLAEAKAQGKPVILDYFATWCTDCLRMEKSTFADPRVRKIMTSQFVALQVDVTDPNDPESKAIKKRFKVFGPPALLFFDAQGNEMKDLHFYGYKNAEDLLVILEKFN